jgi:hypothetical protein
MPMDCLEVEKQSPCLVARIKRGGGGGMEQVTANKTFENMAGVQYFWTTVGTAT